MEEYSWGTVAEISDNQIVIVEYNYETEEEQKETYTIAPDVELLGIAALSEIKVGDDVEFRYTFAEWQEGYFGDWLGQVRYGRKPGRRLERIINIGFF